MTEEEPYIFHYETQEKAKRQLLARRAVLFTFNKLKKNHGIDIPFPDQYKIMVEMVERAGGVYK